MKRMTSVISIILVLLVGMIGYDVRALAQSADYGIDIVIVIDRSGTMKNTDPNNVARAVTNQFIDRCNLADNSVAVITYGYGVIWDSGFVDLSDVTNRNALKTDVNANINAATLDGFEDTNTGTALDYAYDLIQERKQTYPDHRYAILLISDGKVDVGDSKGFEAAHQGKTKEELQLAKEQEISASVNAGTNVAQLSGAQDIGIYCLGVYHNSKENLGTDLENWARISGGMYEITEGRNESELVRIVRDYYNEITGNSSIDCAGPFTVPRNVLEVNIEILSLDSVKNINLTDPNGQLIDLVNADGKSVIVSEDSYYKSIKLIAPIAGQWDISSPNGLDDLQIVITYNMDLAMDLQLDKNVVANGMEVTAQLSASRQNSPYYDANGAMILQVTSADGSTQDFGMVYDSDEQLYTGVFSVSGTGEYNVCAYTDTDSMRNYSNTELLTVQTRGVEYNGSLNDLVIDSEPLPTSEMLYVPDLYTLFDNPDSVQITSYNIKIFPDYYAAWRIDENTRSLYVSGLQEGECTISISATDINNAVSPEAQAKITVANGNHPVARNSAKQTPKLATIFAFMPQDEYSLVLTNVSDYFVEEDANQGFAEFSAFSQNSYVAETYYDESSDSIYAKGISQGTATIPITCTGTDSTSVTMTVQLRVVDYVKLIQKYGLIAACAAAVALIAVAICIHAAMARYPKAELRIMVNNGQLGSEEEGYVHLRGYAKRKVKLTELMRRADLSTIGFSALTDKMIVAPRKNGISIKSNIKGLGKREATIRIGAERTFDLGGDESIMITLELLDRQLV